MIRCTDCGSERAADQCPHCGLTGAAAELVLRRRLVWRTAWFLAGWIVFVPVSQIFPPLELDGILIFAGLIFFGSLALAYGIDFRVRRGREVEIFKHIYFGFIPLPWLLAGLLFFNGKLDRSAIMRAPATVVGKTSIGRFPRSRRLAVTSWRPGRRYESVAVDYDDFNRFKPGDEIVVETQNGALGIPWVYGVYRR